MAARKPPLVKVSKPKARVPSPKAVSTPKPKKAPRIYSKTTTNQDPSAFSNWSFGDTGLTGES